MKKIEEMDKESLKTLFDCLESFVKILGFANFTAFLILAENDIVKQSLKKMFNIIVDEYQKK